MTDLTLFDFCVFSQRLGSSRQLAWRSWKRYNPGARQKLFWRAWKAARAAEELRAIMQPGLSRRVEP